MRASLTAESGPVDLGGRTVQTWSYGGRLPGEAIRCTAGDLLEVTVGNRLREPTTVHWHGLRLRNDMDGMPHLTQPVIAAGDTMRYSFVAPDPGTYWLHPRVGVQRERGLYAPLIIDDPREAGDYDVEFVVALDDGIDGATATPDQVLARLREGGMMARYAPPSRRGRSPTARTSGSTTSPVRWSTPWPGTGPVTVDTVQIASGERYDLLVTLGDGAFPLVAVAEAKQAQALGVVRTASGPTPDAAVEVGELAGRPLALPDLRATPAVRDRDAAAPPDTRHTVS